MSFENLLKHKAQVWRPTQGVGPRREIADTFTLVTDPTGYNCEPFVLDNKQVDEGPGLQPSGRKRWGMRKDADVRRRDVLRVTAGANAPSRWLIDQDPYLAYGGHHWEFWAEPYVGPPLPPDVPVEEEES